MFGLAPLVIVDFSIFEMSDLNHFTNLNVFLKKHKIILIINFLIIKDQICILKPKLITTLKSGHRCFMDKMTSS